jgi:hypothetical protein
MGAKSMSEQRTLLAWGTLVLAAVVLLALGGASDTIVLPLLTFLPRALLLRNAVPPMLRQVPGWADE